MESLLNTSISPFQGLAVDNHKANIESWNWGKASKSIKESRNETELTRIFTPLPSTLSGYLQGEISEYNSFTSVFLFANQSTNNEGLTMCQVYIY